MGAAQDTRYLEKMAGGRYRVVVNVPVHLRAGLGRSKLKQTLGTDSLVEANRLKGPVVEALKRQIEIGVLADISDDTVNLAMKYRRRLVEADDQERLRQEYTDRERLLGEIAEVAEGIQGDPIGRLRGDYEYDPTREARATAFHEIATGKTTPLSALTDDFRRERGATWEGKTWGKFEKIIGDLDTWLGSRRGVAVIEGITRRSAGDFVTAMVREHGWRRRRSTATYLPCASTGDGWSGAATSRQIRGSDRTCRSVAGKT